MKSELNDYIGLRLPGSLMKKIKKEAKARTKASGEFVSASRLVREVLEKHFA